MKIYFVFNIKGDVFDIYRDTPSVLYNFFYNIYNENKDNLNYANSLFRKITNKFNKEYLDLKIYINMHYKMRYSKKYDNHIINDIFKNEISIMKIKKSYIIINSNKKNTEFLKILNYFYKECLVYDFINQEYFFANEKILV